MKRSIDRHSRIVKSAEANLLIEGFHVSEQCKKDCWEMLRGNTTADKLVAQYKKRLTEK